MFIVIQVLVVKYILESHQIFQKDAGEMVYINMLQIHTLLKLYKSMDERILHMKFYMKD
nr:MAG TPA: hypothetical protein [Caudoviricetes sp.]